MTTLAYKNNVIAYDSRVTKGNLICDDDFDKHVIKDGVHFFIPGPLDKYKDIIKAWFKEDFNKDICPTGSVIVWDGKTIFEFSIYEDGRLSISENARDKHFALGSGEDHAFTAMDMGATAEDAVLMASKRDVNTGGKIRTFNL